MDENMDASYGSVRRPKRFSGGQPWNYPPAHASTGSQTNVPTPKGYGAPLANTRIDASLEQRLSERILAFSSRLPLQWWLRERRTVLVTPLDVNAHQLQAPSSMRNWGPTEGGGSLTAPGSSGSGGQVPLSDNAMHTGMYARDYSLQTQMGAVHYPSMSAAPQLQSVPGYNDIYTQVILNGQYSMINTDLSRMYTGLRAPGPYENMGVKPVYDGGANG